MFFWIGLGVVLVVFVIAVGYGARGMGDREHEPGTQYMFRKRDR